MPNANINSVCLTHSVFLSYIILFILWVQSSIDLIKYTKSFTSLLQPTQQLQKKIGEKFPVNRKWITCTT